MKLKILVICTTFLPKIGGSEYIVDNLAQNWALAGHEVLVLNQVASEPVSQDKKYQVEKLNSVHGYKLGLHRWPFRWNVINQIKRTAKRFKPDIAIAHMAYPSGIWLMNANLKARTVISCEAADIHTFPQYNVGYRHRLNIDKPLRKALSACDAIRTSSTKLRKIIIGELGVKRDDIEVIFNGADPILSDKQSSMDIDGFIGVSSKDLILLRVANYRKFKGHEIAIKAFANISKKYPNWHYVIIGGKLENLRPLVNDLNIGDKVHLLDKTTRNQVVAIYQRANLYVSASEIEGFPVTVAEAIMAGLPLLLSDVSGHYDVIKPGENGYLFPVNDIQLLTEKLSLLFEKEELRGKFSKYNRELSPQFEWKFIAQQYMDKLFLS